MIIILGSYNWTGSEAVAVIYRKYSNRTNSAYTGRRTKRYKSANKQQQKMKGNMEVTTGNRTIKHQFWYNFLPFPAY